MVLDLLGSSPALSFCGRLVSIPQLLMGLEKTAVTLCGQVLSSVREERVSA